MDIDKLKEKIEDAKASFRNKIALPFKEWGFELFRTVKDFLRDRGLLGEKPKRSLVVKAPDVGELGERPLSRFFYAVSNHNELFQLANSYWADYQNGEKIFGFISPSPTQAKEKTILGVASYFDRNAYLKIALIGQTLRRGLYRKLLAKSETVEVDLGIDYGRHFQIDRLYNVDFVDFTALCEVAKEARDNFTYESALKKLLDSYGLILWDTPDLDFFKHNPVLCFPMMLNVDDLTVVLRQKGESIKKLKEIHDFFDRYGVKIKGHVLEN